MRANRWGKDEPRVYLEVLSGSERGATPAVLHLAFARLAYM